MTSGQSLVTLPEDRRTPFLAGGLVVLTKYTPQKVAPSFRLENKPEDSILLK